MKLALFRVDGSLRLGMGHIVRCLAFAECLKNIGVKSLFVIKDYEQNVDKTIKQCGFEVVKIPNGYSLARDAQFTIKVAAKQSAGILIADLAHTDNMNINNQYHQYFESFLSINRFTIAIDDFVGLDLPFDIRVIPYYGAESNGYKAPAKTKLLLGAKYFIFKQEFLEVANVQRRIKPVVENILVTMGGSDPFGLTAKFLKVINCLDTSLLNIRVLIGPAFSVQAKTMIQKELSNFKGRSETISNRLKMADLMLWADIALTAGGLTKYEAAATGTPSVAIAPFDREAEMGEKFSRAGTNLYLGSTDTVNEMDILQAIKKLIKNHVWRVEMSERGKALLDCKGIERIISEIPPVLLN